MTNLNGVKAANRCIRGHRSFKIKTTLVFDTFSQTLFHPAEVLNAYSEYFIW